MENIFTVAKPFLTFAKLVGVFPMSFEGNARKGKLKFHILNLIPSAIILGFHIPLIVFFLISRNLFASLKYSKVSYEIWNILTVFKLLTELISLTVQLFKFKNVVELLNLIRNFDNEVNVIGLN